MKKQLPSAEKEVLSKRRCFFEALDKALGLVRAGKYFELVIKRKCLDKWFVCSQIERTIEECRSEIRSLSEENLMEILKAQGVGKSALCKKMLDCIQGRSKGGLF